MTRWQRVWPIALTWGLLSFVLVLCLLRATFAAAPGQSFLGTLFHVPDFYNYLSYVQQAEDGALVFRNKLADPRQPAVLVNLEWLLVGWLSRALGGAPVVAYHALGLLALAINVVLVDRWLTRAGLRPGRRPAALLLVFTGGGMGGMVALIASEQTVQRYGFDLFAGIYPFVETLSNPHFVIGTTLLVATLAAFACKRFVLGIVLGNALALVRPYDAAIVVGVETLAVILLERPRSWPRRVGWVLLLLPTLAYDAWLFLWSSQFGAFSSEFYAQLEPSMLTLAAALGPAIAIALLALRLPRDGGAAHRHRTYLALWAIVAIGIDVVRPVPFALQFLAGVGLPLLALGAIGLAAMRGRLLEWFVPVFATSAMVLTWSYSSPLPHVVAPTSHFAVAAALEPVCRPGQVVLASAEIGLHVGARTSCWPYLSHGVAQTYEPHEARRQRFLAGSPRERAAFLEEICASYVVLPGAWSAAALPPGTPYRPLARVADGEPLLILARDPAIPCDGGATGRAASGTSRMGVGRTP